MQIATDAIKESDKERQKALFEHMMEAFLKNWAPKHPYDRDDFDRALFSLVRQIYQDAQAPLLKQLTDLYSAMPLMPLVRTEPK